MGHNNRLSWIRHRGSGMRDPGRVKIIDYFRGSGIRDPGCRIPYLGSGDPGSWIRDPGRDPGSGIPDPGSGIRDPGGAKLIIFQDAGSN